MHVLYGHGKKGTAFKNMKKQARDFQLLALLGTHLNLNQETEDACVAFVGAMYGKGSMH